jgi:hypothetical protein
MRLKKMAWILVIACVVIVAPVAHAHAFKAMAVLGSHFDGTAPTPNPIPMGPQPPHSFDGTAPTPNPIPMGPQPPHSFDGTAPTPNPIPMGPQPPHQF